MLRCPCTLLHHSVLGDRPQGVSAAARKEVFRLGYARAEWHAGIFDAVSQAATDLRELERLRKELRSRRERCVCCTILEQEQSTIPH